MTFGAIAQTDDKIVLATSSIFVEKSIGDIEFLMNADGKNVFKVTLSVVKEDSIKGKQPIITRPAINECVIKFSKSVINRSAVNTLLYPDEILFSIDGSDIKFGAIIQYQVGIGIHVSAEFYTVFESESDDKKE